MPPRENSRYRLLVEGSDDKFTVLNLLTEYGYDWNDNSIIRPYVVDCGGKDVLLQQDLPGAVKGNSYDQIGVILDADEDCAERWTDCKNALSEFGVDFPDTPSGGGSIFRGKKDSQRVGIWLMPDNSEKGILEDFVSTLVPPDDKLWPMAEAAVQDAADTVKTFSEAKRAKAEIHTWLAWQEEPGMPLGLSISVKVLTKGGPLAESFVKWFKDLFPSTLA